MNITRRQFLHRVGYAGGFSAAFLTMQGLDLLPVAPAHAETVQASRGSGLGTKVVVAGGGIAGLVAAYELRALGYSPVLLEARSRPGGRNYSVRGGDTVKLTDGSSQQCGWADGNYQNFGPARLPSIHPTILSYCRKLNVELQVEVNMSRSAHMQNDVANNGSPMVMRQAVNDTRGHVSELLMKSLNQGALDSDLSAEDRTRMKDFLRVYGPLDKAGDYTGSDRAGYSIKAGAGEQTAVLSEPIDMHTLLNAEFWQGMLYDEEFDMQATMFQPVGGMDRIPYAFAKSLGDIMRYNCPVTEIYNKAKGVEVTYLEEGMAKKIDADFCICAMPLTTLRKVGSNFSPPFKKVIAECTYAGAYKVAWESRRFWEQDYNIYGGLEFVTRGCSPVWFPSAGMFKERGIVVSGYADELGTPFNALSLNEKYEESRRSMERLHPGHGHELEKPIYYGWSKSQWNEGSWIHTYGPGQDRYDWRGMTSREAAAQRGNQAPGMDIDKQTGQAQSPASSRVGTNPGYETMIQPDGRVLFAGDHCSHIVGWQEGAALSAIRAVQLIADQVRA